MSDAFISCIEVIAMANGQGWWFKDGNYSYFSPIACFLTVRVADSGSVYQSIIAIAGNDIRDFAEVKSDGISIIRRDLINREIYHESEFEIVGEELK